MIIIIISRIICVNLRGGNPISAVPFKNLRENKRTISNLFEISLVRISIIPIKYDEAGLLISERSLLRFWLARLYLY